MYWLLAIAAFTVTPFDVTVRTLDGSVVQGNVASWDQSSVELKDEDTLRRIERDELAEVSFAPVDSQAAAPSLTVLLGDGVLPAQDFVWQGQQVQITSRLGSVPSELPFDSVRAVRFDLSETEQDVAWQQLTQRSRTSDWLVVYKKSRGALDYVEGVVKQITADSVTLLLDEEPLELPREKVFGIIFYRRVAEESLTKSVQVLGPYGLSLAARDVRFEASRIEIELLSGSSIELSLEAIAQLEFSTDRITYLTDLVPIEGSPRWKPYFSLPQNASLLESWGAPRRNESFQGSRLQVLLRGADGRPVLQDFERGLALRGRSEQSYQIPEGHRVLKAVVGMDPAANEHADALLVIEADGELLGEWHLQRSQPAQSIEVDISDKRQLRLFVDYGSGTDAGDIVHLCEPRLIK